MTGNTHISLNNFADIVGVSRATVNQWIVSGKCKLHLDDKGRKYFIASELESFEEISAMLNSNWDKESKVMSRRNFTSVELFAGGGGLALGLHKAGFKHLLLNEFDKDACATLKKNMPEWNVIQGDIHNVDFTPYAGKVDLLTGGFPCQAFSYAGKRLGFEETRGTLFLNWHGQSRKYIPRSSWLKMLKGCSNTTKVEP